MSEKGQQEKVEQAVKKLATDKRPDAVGFATKEPGDLELGDRLQRHALRKWLPTFVAWLVVFWLVFVVVVTVFAGVGKLDYNASVLVTLLGSATASIIGLLLKVVGYALPEKELRP